MQLFVDDFQAPVWGARYRVTIDGERMQGMEQGINALEQTGPVGKLVSLSLLPEYHRLLADGRLELLIDDPATGAEDGYAVDFVRVLINPGEMPFNGVVHGRVVRASDVSPIAGALVTTALGRVETDADGRYSIANVPAGLAVVRAGNVSVRPL